MTGRILAFGASGKFAGLVLPELAARGVTVRAFLRREDEAEGARSRGASEVAFGKLEDRASVREALRGVERVFYLSPVSLPGEAEIGRAIVEDCVEAGVERFVFSSVIHPVLGSLPNHAAKARIEQAVLESGLAHTFLHPGLFFQNFLRSWKEVAETGVLAEPWSCATRFSRVDYRDVAEVAAIALTEDQLLYGTFELCAEGWHDRHDVAALMATALGREVRAKRIDPETVEGPMEPLKPMMRHYDRTGLRGNPLTLRAILGREARTLGAFFDELTRGEEGGPT